MSPVNRNSAQSFPGNYDFTRLTAICTPTYICRRTRCCGSFQLSPPLFPDPSRRHAPVTSPSRAGAAENIRLAAPSKGAALIYAAASIIIDQTKAASGSCQMPPQRTVERRPLRFKTTLSMPTVRSKWGAVQQELAVAALRHVIVRHFEPLAFACHYSRSRQATQAVNRTVAWAQRAKRKHDLRNFSDSTSSIHCLPHEHTTASLGFFGYGHGVRSRGLAVAEFHARGLE